MQTFYSLTILVTHSHDMGGVCYHDSEHSLLGIFKGKVFVSREEAETARAKVMSGIMPDFENHPESGNSFEVEIAELSLAEIEEKMHALAQRENIESPEVQEQWQALYQWACAINKTQDSQIVSDLFSL